MKKIFAIHYLSERHISKSKNMANGEYFSKKRTEKSSRLKKSRQIDEKGELKLYLDNSKKVTTIIYLDISL